jgi:uncharacterized protein (UPF0248 family)
MVPSEGGGPFRMVVIQELLNRIRWDRDFGAASFEVGYLDHIRNAVVRIPFRVIRFQPGNRFSFEFEDDDGEVLSIPLHRIREVYRNGTLIWLRPATGRGPERTA